MDTKDETPQRASERDREDMRRMERTPEQEQREHEARSPRDRLIAALAPMFGEPGVERLNPSDDDNPAEFYERAKRLGLYKGSTSDSPN